MKNLLSQEKSLLKSACLGLGLATAWEVESAEAHTVSALNGAAVVSGVIEPAQPLSLVSLLYAHNATGFNIYGKKLFETLPPTPTPYLVDTGWNDSAIRLFEGERYAIFGGYGGDVPGVTLSFASGAGIIETKTWSDLFENPNDGRKDYAEAHVLLALNGAYVDEDAGITVTLNGFFKDYYDVIGAPYGQDSVLINFSTGAYGGRVTGVPEPTTLIGFGFGLLALILIGRRQRAP